MSLFDELAKNGISAEDLEKAASVRLFEKAAADEGINLNELTEEQVNALFEKYVTEILPAQAGGEPAQDPKQASAIDAEKVASVTLFQKVAEEENIDLNTLDEKTLEGLYQHFLENVLPGMVQEQESKQANAENIKEAQAKLAEVDILGRYMARAYADELQKIAREVGPPSREEIEGAIGGGKQLEKGQSPLSHAASTKGGVRPAFNIGDKEELEEMARSGKGVRATISQAATRGKELATAAGARGKSLGGAALGAMKAHPKTTAGLAAAGLLTAGGLTYGGHKLKQKHEAAEKTSSLFDKIAEEKAVEILQANGIDPATGAKAEETQPTFEDAVNARAIEMLQAAGYTFEG